MATTTAVPKAKISGGSFLLESRQPEEIFTPEDFSEQHQLIGQTAEEFAVNEILPNVEKIEHKDFSVSRELLKKAGELGLSGGRNSRSLRRPRNGQGHRRRDRRPHREVCRLRHHLGRAQRHRHAAHRVLRHRRTEEQISAAPGRGRNCRRVCPVGSVVWLGRAQLPRPRRTFGRRQALHPQRRKDVDHQRRLRRPVHRVRQNRRREVQRVPGRENFPWILGRRRRTQDGHSRIVDLPHHSQRLQSAGRKSAGRNRQGTRDRLQHFECRTLQAGRDVRGRRPRVAGKRHRLRQAAQSVQQGHRRLRAGAGKNRQHGDAALCRRIAGLSHGRHDGRGAERGRQIGRRRRQADAEGDRGVRGRVLHY